MNFAILLSDRKRLENISRHSFNPKQNISKDTNNLNGTFSERLDVAQFIFFVSFAQAR